MSTQDLVLNGNTEKVIPMKLHGKVKISFKKSNQKRAKKERVNFLT